MYKRSLFATALMISLANVSAPALAQQAGGLITVQIADVDILRNSLNNNDVDVLNNFLNDNNLLNNNQLAAPINVQVPIGIAAVVCDTTVLALKDDTDSTCTAEQASSALGQAVAKQTLGSRSGK